MDTIRIDECIKAFRDHYNVSQLDAVAMVKKAFTISDQMRVKVKVADDKVSGSGTEYLDKITTSIAKDAGVYYAYTLHSYFGISINKLTKAELAYLNFLLEE